MHPDPSHDHGRLAQIDLKNGEPTQTRILGRFWDQFATHKVIGDAAASSDASAHHFCSVIPDSMKSEATCPGHRSAQNATPSAPPADWKKVSVFRLRNRKSQKCVLTSYASDENGKEVQQDENCKRNHDATRFYLHKLSDGNYTIQPLHSKKCFDVAGWSKDDWARVHQWKCHYGENQRWKISSVSNGFFRIKSVHSNKCLGVEYASTDNYKFYEQQPCESNGHYQHFEPLYD